MGFDPLALAVAVKYYLLEEERKVVAPPRKKSRKTGWALLFWIFGIGFILVVGAI